MQVMSKRLLYIGCYDISCNKRLRRALRILRQYATGGQKSVFECYLSPVECHQLLEEMSDLLDVEEDRFLLIRLDGRRQVRVLGKAVPPRDPWFFYVG